MLTGIHLNKERGSLLVMLLLVTVVMALLGVASLFSSQTSMKISSHFRGATSLAYQAEEGLYKAVGRIQAIADPTRQDPLYAAHLYTGAEKEISFLLTPGTPDNPLTHSISPSCPEPFDPESSDQSQKLDSVIDVNGTGLSNVICNFLGSSLPATQVIVVRENDFTENSFRAAILLINSIARDTSGRRQIAQGVVIVPYEQLSSGDAYRLPAGQSPYLASVVKGGAT